MTLSEGKNLLVLGAVGIALYLVWKGLNKVPQALATGTDALAQGIANAWLSMTAPPGVGAIQGNALLPNGSYVPMSQLPLKGMTDTGGTFHLYTQYQGQYYELQPSDINGDFPAVAVS